MGPISGGIVASVLYDSLMIKRPDKVAEEEAPHGFAHGEDTMRPESEM